MGSPKMGRGAQKGRRGVTPGARPWSSHVARASGPSIYPLRGGPGVGRAKSGRGSSLRLIRYQDRINLDLENIVADLPVRSRRRQQQGVAARRLSRRQREGDNPGSERESGDRQLTSARRRGGERQRSQHLRIERGGPIHRTAMTSVGHRHQGPEHERQRLPAQVARLPPSAAQYSRCFRRRDRRSGQPDPVEGRHPPLGIAA